MTADARLLKCNSYYLRKSQTWVFCDHYTLIPLRMIGIH